MRFCGDPCRLNFSLQSRAANDIHSLFAVPAFGEPGGDATGFVLFDYSLSTKWLALLKEIAPGVKRVATFGIPQSVPGMRGPDFSGAAFGPITDLRSARPCKRRILTIVQEPSFQGHRHCRAMKESNHRSRP